MKAGPVASSGVANERELLAFAEAAVGEDDEALRQARDALAAALGTAALADAAAVVASFNSVVRIADATGIALEPAKLERTVALRAELGIEV